MIIPLVEIGCAAVIIVALLILVIRGLSQRGVPQAARRLVALGLGLLLLGGFQYSFLRSEDDPQAAGSFINLWLYEVLLLCGGVFLTIGLLLLGKAANDINRRRKLEAMLMKTLSDLESSKGLLDSIMVSSLGGLLVLRAVRNKSREVEDFEICMCNPALEQLLGIPRKNLLGVSLLTALPCLKAEGLFDKAMCLVNTGLPIHIEHKSRTETETDKWYEIVAVKHADGIAATVSDISHRKSIENELRRIAHTDALTGLCNRALLKERLEQAILRAQRLDNYQFAVMFLDFDRFKVVNDSLGHEVGDQLLISIADRLRANIRAIDVAATGKDGHLPARLGGDEFVILLDGIKEASHAAIIADRLQRDLATPHRLGGHEVISTASIGIVTCSGQYETADEVLRDADTAMYHAKTAGKARHVVFDEGMHQDAIACMNLEGELRKAVEREVFLLEYQPILKLDSGLVVGFEALIRWPHPDRGVLPPREFLELAEELDLLVEIGQWVLQQACTRLRSMQLIDPGLTMNVNHSKQEILHKNFVTHVRQVIDETGVDPTSLQLEVTEDVCMSHPKEIIAVLHQLKDVGVQLAMDDFGTGHSSFSQLDQFPFDTLKIDRCFLRSNRQKRGYAAILQSMIDLAHNLQMSTVVEGVETQDHLSLLQALGCQYGQGWLFGEAVPADQAEANLRNTRDINTAA